MERKKNNDIYRYDKEFTRQHIMRNDKVTYALDNNEA